MLVQTRVSLLDGFGAEVICRQDEVAGVFDEENEMGEASQSQQDPQKRLQKGGPSCAMITHTHSPLLSLRSKGDFGRNRKHGLEITLKQKMKGVRGLTVSTCSFFPSRQTFFLGSRRGRCVVRENELLSVMMRCISSNV